ncbi:MAG TPA: histidine phosphatase family protein [Candidatus Binatia bacterium]|nr:histidine phosphatase family protein [Candidatus Binatia bacterium]
MKWLVVFAAGILCAQAQPKEIVIIRHGEEPNGNSIHLSAKGQKRAQALADFFQTNSVVMQFGPPEALFAARPKPGGSKRTVETAAPTSEALGQPLRQPFTEQQYGALAQKILQTPSFKGKTVIIVWTHSNIDNLAAALGVRPRPNWKSSVYDRAWVLVRSQGRVTLKDIPQRLLPGDSKR